MVQANRTIRRKEWCSDGLDFQGLVGYLMNNVVKSEHATVPIDDPQWVASMAMRQLKSDNETFIRSIPDLFLHEAFALGYAVGFAEQAFGLLNKGDGEKSCADYVRRSIGAMLGDDTVAASFVSYAASKQGNRVFEGGTTPECSIWITCT